MKHLITILSIFSVLLIKAQTINISDADFDAANPIDCSTTDFILGVSNFFDDGGSAGNYGQNVNDTIVICPNLTDNDDISFSTDFTTAEFDIHPSDTLYVYDGDNTSAPLIAAINNGNYVNPTTIVSSFSNTSGCLTFVFISNGDADVGTGWNANIACATPVQPFNLGSQAFVNHDYSDDRLLTDSLFVDVCFGDTVEIVLNRTYPLSEETLGSGYSQTNDNVSEFWFSSTGDTWNDLDTIEFVIDVNEGFIITSQALDQLLYTEERETYIRVGLKPNFSGLSVTPDTTCINQEVQLYGGYNALEQYAYGVTPNPGVVQIGGEVAGQTYLPDGSGVNYTTTINIQGFPDDDTLSPTCGLDQICLNMEHSYLGDLEATITCPNGTVAVLFNSYSGGSAGQLAPGGFGGGGTFLGEPIDVTSSAQPGNGFIYCYADDATLGTLGDEFAAGAVVPTTQNSPGSTMPAGTYLPEDNFETTLQGCPLNGDWTITVRDNIGADDGFIFGWNLLFDNCFYGDALAYSNVAVSGEYVNVMPILSQTDSTLNTTVNNFGVNPYQFVVEDDYGCFHDTIINAFVWSPVTLNLPDSVCGNMVNGTLNVGQNGVWSFYNSPGTATFGSVNLINTSISVDVPGIYNLVYTDLTCGDADTAQVNFLEIPTFNMSGNFFYCPGGTPVITVGNSAEFSSINWGVASETNDTTFVYSPPNGTFFVTGIGANTCSQDTLITISTQTPINLQEDTHSCGLSYEMLQNQWGLQTNGGTWEQISGPGNSMFLDVNALNTTVTADQYGVYSYRYIEPVCGNGDTIVITMSDNPEFDLGNVDYFYCPGTTENIAIQDSLNLSSASWGIANPALDTLFSAQLEEGMHTLTIVNMFGCSNDSTFTITTQQAIQLSVQPEICGDSLYMNANIGSEPGFWQSINSQGETGQVTFWSPHTLTTSVSLDQLDTYQFIYTDSVCYDSDTATVKFNPYPSVYGENVVVCSGESGVLVVQPYGEPETIVWENGVTGTTITVTDEGEYEVVATNGCGSFTTSIMLEKRDCEVKMPNVFTPNGKGGNDLFKVIDVNNGIVEFNCEIVNRWGNVVYEYNDINSGWDGNTKNGTPAEDGTYFYKVTAKTVSGVDLSTEGFVQLIR